ncbi:MAG: 4Fe-4S dicluster domain-containing protein [Phycisphaerae bacterium]|nr:4Fe-4S dicluster domain-containing protein [Phycisphaerae bacterium]
MLARRYATFTGGIDLPDLKDATLDAPVRPGPVPARLRVPLAPCGGPPAEPVVAAGQRVVAGQRLGAASDDAAVDVYAPATGTVSRLTRVATAGRYGPAHSDAVELVELEHLPELPAEPPTAGWRELAAAQVRERIADGALTTFRRGAEPLSGWIERARAAGCRVLIANVMEHEPYVTADHALLRARGRQVAGGLMLLGRAIGAETVYLAADRRRTDDYHPAEDAARELGIEPVALEHKYPTGADVMLVKILTRCETPPGGSPTDVGAAVVDAATCFATYAQVACGVRPSGRVVTVAGERTSRVGNFFVPFGVGCVDLVGAPGPPVLHGGAMTALRCDEATVTSPASDAVLAPAVETPPHPGPCIRCGWCVAHCPARLNVAALNDAFELADVDRAARLGVRACIACGVCSYICPARLPLTQRMNQLNRAVGRVADG